MSTADLVLVCGVAFGPAPVVLPAAQVARLMRHGGCVLALELLNGGDAATPTVMFASGEYVGITSEANGDIRLTRPGRYAIVDNEGNALAAKRAAGAAPNEPSRNVFRQAQYLCAVIGTLILNLLLWFDAGNRMANAKDFVINYASDIIAVGSVLIITDVLLARDAVRHDTTTFGFVAEFASNLWNGHEPVRRHAEAAQSDGDD